MLVETPSPAVTAPSVASSTCPGGAETPSDADEALGGGSSGGAGATVPGGESAVATARARAGSGDEAAGGSAEPFAQMSDDDLAQSISEVSGEIEALMALRLGLVAEYDCRRSYLQDGAPDMACWLTERLTMSCSQAREIRSQISSSPCRRCATLTGMVGSRSTS